jgi:signal transduction histidine kinase
MHEYKQAIENFRQAIAQTDICADLRQKLVISVNLIKSLIQNGDYSEAEELVSFVQQKADETKSAYTQRILYKAKSELLAKTGDFKSALELLRKFMEISEEAYNEDRRREMDTLKISYDTEKKEFKSKLLTAQNRNLNREVKKQSEIIHRNERQLFDQEKFATIGKLYANFAHEIKSPFQILYNGLNEFEQVVNSLKQDLYLNRTREDLNGKINRSKWMIDYISASVRDTDVFYETETSLNKVIEDYLGYLAAPVTSKGFEIRADLDRALPLILGDAGRLTQIVSNLVKNAAEAMESPQHGSNLISIRTFRKDANICLEIEDSGKGIKPGELNSIFRQFYTTKPQGLGLGLFNVRKFVEQMRGDITVHENKGKPGLTFRITFPAYVSAI